MSGDQVVQLARGWIGTPYHHQAAVRGVGCDCLGMVRGLWRELYGSDPEAPPPYSQTWGDHGTVETMLLAAERNLERVAVAPPRGLLAYPDPAPGAVLFFRPRRSSIAKHCAILAGAGIMVHAYSGVGVRETSIGIWRTRLAAVFRFPGH